MRQNQQVEVSIYDRHPIVQLSVTPDTFLKELNGGQAERLKDTFPIDLSLNETPLKTVLFFEQYINPRWAFVFNSEGHYIAQSAYLKPESLVNSILEKDRTASINLNADYIYFMAYNHDYANYYHWTIQCLPTFSLYFSLKSLYPNLKVLLPEGLPDFALQYLKILGIDLEKEVEFLPLQEQLFFAKQLIYPSLLGGEFSFNTSQTLLQFANSYFEKSLKNGHSPFNFFSRERNKILYCSRLDSPNRKITNEGALVDILKNKYGAKIFISTGQSVKDQARKFYESDIIIAPHGAGLSNIIYCHPKATVIELMPDKYVNPCFATLAINKGCDYHPLVFPTKVFEGHQHEYEWEIDLNAIEAILTKLI